MKPKHLLFVTHDMSRSGAPIVLLHFLRWLKSNTNYDVSIIAIYDGDLRSDLEQIGPVYLWDNRSTSIISRIRKKLFKKRKYNRRQRQILQTLRQNGADLIYLNTVVSNSILPDILTVIKAPVISHIHENEYSLKAEYSKYLQPDFLRKIDRFIAVSTSTRNGLSDNFGVPARSIFTTYEFISLADFKNPSKDFRTVRNELKIDPNAFVIGGAGTFLWRKGIDLFLQVAYVLKQMRPSMPVKFIWIGGDNDPIMASQINYELKRFNLIDYVLFAGKKHDPENYFQIFDIFALTSREDPFPLVCIETASLGKPIVCFENAGGIPEMICKGGGYIVPYGDVHQMAAKILFLLENKADYLVNAKKVLRLSSEYDVNVLAPGIVSVINDLVSN